MPQRTEKQLVMGSVSDRREPVWEPLEFMVGSRTREFMWMFEVAMEDGTAVQAYKHVATRAYFHIGSDGRSFEFRAFGGDGPSGYQQIPFLKAAGMVLHQYDQEKESLREPGEIPCCDCPLKCWD